MYILSYNILIFFYPSLHFVFTVEGARVFQVPFFILSVFLFNSFNFFNFSYNLFKAEKIDKYERVIAV